MYHTLIAISLILCYELDFLNVFVLNVSSSNNLLLHSIQALAGDKEGVELPELLELMAKSPSRDTAKEQILKAFKAFDTANKGTISLGECLVVALCLRELFQQVELQDGVSVHVLISFVPFFLPTTNSRVQGHHEDDGRGLVGRRGETFELRMRRYTRSQFHSPGFIISLAHRRSTGC